MAHPLKKSDRKREEPKLGEPKLGEPKLVGGEDGPEVTIAQELQGESVSDTLIRARQQVGQDLRSIAEVLCIRYSYLEAIERGEYENLPGATYAVGFVRSYADYLGLDGAQVVDRFKSEVEGLDSQTKLHFPTPAPEGKMPGGAVFLVAALLFASAYGVWFYLSNNGDSLSDLVAPVPDRLQELVDGDAPSATAETSATAENSAPATVAPAEPEADSSTATPPASDPAPQASEPAAAPAEAETAAEVPAAPAEAAPDAPPGMSQMADPSAGSAPDGAGESAQQAAVAAPEAPADTTPAAEVPAGEAPADEVPAETPAADEPPASDEAPASDEPYAIPAAPENDTPASAFLNNHEPQVYGEENAEARIVLKATQDAWVQVRDRQGTLLLTRVLRVGDSYRVPNQGDLTLLTGNAGGLEISVDGRALAPLGPVGAVRRDIPLDPEALAGGAGR